MSTLQDKWIYENRRCETLEYDGLAASQEVTIVGYGNTVIIHGDMEMGSELKIQGADARVIVEGSMSFYSVIHLFSGGEQVSVGGNMFANAKILANYSVKTVYVQGWTSRRALIRVGSDSVVGTEPNLDELTPEEYGVYAVDRLNQDALGPYYSPHMGMPFQQWLAQRTPRSFR